MPELRRVRTAPAAVITRQASMQSYLTVQLLADRAYRSDAFALYAYFRWLDDMVDEVLDGEQERCSFVSRQRELLAAAAAGSPCLDVSPDEALLVGLVDPARPRPGGRREGDDQRDALLLSMTSMFDVMEFDARRRGRRVTQAQLDGYTTDLAVAVTEALHHCIGHGQGCPRDETRYVAVSGAHVAHMLRDTVEDLEAGYVNVSLEVAPGSVAPCDLHDAALRAWVRDRVDLARSSFASGRRYLARVDNGRCRLAGHAYIARFEWVLGRIESDGYRLRPGYAERGTFRGGVTIAADALRSAWDARQTRSGPPADAVLRKVAR